MPKFSESFGSDFVQGNQSTAHLEQGVLQHLQCFITVFRKGDVGESSVTHSIKHLSSLLTGVQEQSSGTRRETSASFQHPHWDPTWSDQPGQARHTSPAAFPLFWGLTRSSSSSSELSPLEQTPPGHWLCQLRPWHRLQVAQAKPSCVLLIWACPQFLPLPPDRAPCCKSIFLTLIFFER